MKNTKWTPSFNSFVRIIVVASFLFVTFLLPANATPVDNGIPDGYEPSIYNAIPAQQFKDVFETETIEVSGISVTCDGGFDNPFTDTVHFRVFNSTTQETEYEIDTNNNGVSQTLPPLNLKKNHNYIFFVEDENYILGTKKYVQILDANAKMANAGAGAYDYKYKEGNGQYNQKFQKLKSIKVFKRDGSEEDYSRCCIGCTKMPVVVTYKGKPVTEKLSFTFVSDVETRQGSTNYSTEGEGILYANLLEDVTYMVYLDSDKYVMDPFPIVVKDKSEYGEGRYAYNHTTCVRVDSEHPIKLYDDIQEAYDDPALGESILSVTSLKKRVTVTGMNFRHLLILDRVLDKSMAPGMEGKDYEVIGVTAVNPHRWEISKIVGPEFNITKKVEGGRNVTHVYYIDDQNKLNEIYFSQSSPYDVSFKMDSLSLYPIVIEYDGNKSLDEQKAEEEARKRKIVEAWNGQIDGSLPAVKLSSAKAAKKKATVKWKKLSKKQLKKAGTIKIEVQYNTDRNFPMETTKSKFVGKKKSSVKISSLKSKNTYYVRVRTFKNVGSTKHVSKWSKVKKVKIK